jgi:hypothetical protein
MRGVVRSGGRAGILFVDLEMREDTENIQKIPLIDCLWITGHKSQQMSYSPEADTASLRKLQSYQGILRYERNWSTLLLGDGMASADWSCHQAGLSP